jgi:predicted PurR-regulated permease PerM
LLYLIPLIVSEISDLMTMVPFYTKSLQLIFQEMKQGINFGELPTGIKNVIEKNITGIESTLLSILNNLLNTMFSAFSHIVGFIVAPVISFYLLKDSESIRSGAQSLIPMNLRPKFVNILTDLDETLGGYIRGQLLVCSLIALLTTIGLYMINLDYALVLGVIAGIANIIPYFGPVLGAIPAVAIGALNSPGTVIWVVIVFIVVQQIDGAIISPKIIGESIGIHPVIVILSLIFGGQMFGFWGMLLAIPIIAVLKVLLRHITNSIFRVDK